MKKIFYLLALVLIVSSCGSSKPISLKVATYNVRFDNPADSLNNWQHRKEVAAQIVKNESFDVFGTQEVLANQLNDMKTRLPEYTAIGVGRADGKEGGEHCAIFFKKDRFKEIKSGNFWLSETPEEAGAKGWDAACERVTTWAVLEDNETKRRFLFINTHLDHRGKEARQKGVELLLDRAAEYGKGLPVVMTGDFNATPESDVINHVLDKSNPNYLVHSRDLAEKKDDAIGTAHGFGRTPVEKRSFIDYIFVTPGSRVINHSVLPDKLDDIYISDHSVVVAEIEFN